MRLFLLFVLIIPTVYCRGPGEHFTAKDLEKIRMDKKTFEKTQMIHANWYLHSIKAIMGQLGKDVMKKLDTKSKTQFYRCLDGIEDKRDIVAGAKCLMNAKSQYEELKEKRKQIRQRSEEKKSSEVFVQKKKSKKFLKQKKGVMRLKFDDLKYRKKALLRRRFKRSPYRLVTDLVTKSDSHKMIVKNMEKMPQLKTKEEKSAVQRISNLIQVFVRNTTNGRAENEPWADSYKNLLRIKKGMDEMAKKDGAKVYDFRMLDLVLDRKEATRGPNEKSLLPPLVEDAYKLMHVIEGTPMDANSNIKFLSPRFASVMPDKADVRGKLSPNILSFYKDDTEEQIMPIPKLLEETGLKDKDREVLMETIMELSGAKATVSDATQILESMNLFGMEGELKHVTEKMTDAFADLEKSFHGRQKRELKQRKFTFMEAHQLEELYNKQGINHTDTDFDLNEYRNQTKKEREDSLWERIRLIAENATQPTRSKRALVSVLMPVTLSPYMFAPIYGLSILGPTVLSPSLFSPLILNPSVLSPYVLSPAVGMPFILSPYILSPYVLSPLVFAPFILTPYILSPNVINPYVLSPLILSPLILCPDVISPMVLGGSILSPGVASPSVLSKSFLMASVLSPSVLS